MSHIFWLGFKASMELQIYSADKEIGPYYLLYLQHAETLKITIGPTLCPP
jgi:hypothetical protein